MQSVKTRPRPHFVIAPQVDRGWIMQTRNVRVADSEIAVTVVAYNYGLNQPSMLRCNTNILSI